jgi:Raf kinase inhibitor-like YbhB/YbcL family protein
LRCRLPVALVLVAAAAVGCGPDETAPPTGGPQQGGTPDGTGAQQGSGATFYVTSPAFSQARPIPTRHTADGEDLSPPLEWRNVPEGTQEFVLICEDPDAPRPDRPRPDPWVHWVLYKIAGDLNGLPGAVEPKAVLTSPAGAMHGVNSYSSDNQRYRGPGPPPGSGKHRYFFRLYALDTELAVQPGLTKAQVLEKTQGHVLGKCAVWGTYER